MRSLLFFLGVSRAPFLLLTLSVLFFATSLVSIQLNELPLMLLVLVVLCGLSAHIAVNALNEYHDFKSGLDLLTNRTPFSGGSGSLPLNPEGSSATLVFALLSLTLSVAVGLYLVLSVDYNLVIFGLAGVVIVLTYTPWINKNPWLCLLAPGAGFGLIMLPGTVMAFGGDLNLSVWLAGLSVFFLVNNLLLLNQLPDTEADKEVGRRTIPVVKGENHSLAIATVFYACAFLAVVVAVITGLWPKSSLLAGVLLPLPVYTIFGLARAHAPNYPVPALATNVIICLTFPAVVATTILLN